MNFVNTNIPFITTGTTGISSASVTINNTTTPICLGNYVTGSLITQNDYTISGSNIISYIRNKKLHVWKDIKILFNSKTVGEKICRNEILKHMERNNSTQDTYLNMLTATGFIRRIKRGLYEKRLDIPEGYTITELRKKCFTEM